MGPEYAMTLQLRLDGLRAEFDAKTSLADCAIMNRASRQLIESGAVDKIPQMGMAAPAFELPDPANNIVSSTGLLRTGPLVLTFFRGAWCPYCNLDLQALEVARPTIEQAGARV